MSNISSCMSRFRVSKGGLKEPLEKATKRPHDSQACSQCRKSRIRCDRGRPCSNCAKRDGTSCSYPPVPHRGNGDRHAVAEDRLIHLESMVKQLLQNQTPWQDDRDMVSRKSESSPDVIKPTPPEVLSEIPQGQMGVYDQTQVEQAPESRYVGYTHWSAILDDIQELKVALGNYAASQRDGPMVPTQVSFGNDLIFGPSQDYSVQQIMSEYLPSKVEVDRLISIYFRGAGFILPFIHTVQFKRQYHEFWIDTATVNPLWLSMLFSTCYMATLIREAAGSNTKHANQDVARQLYRLHTAAAKSLVAGKYFRPQKLAVEALAMYGQSKLISTLNSSREAGLVYAMAIRIGYEMGYHREPDIFGSVTVFEGELRRRLWACCKQIDLLLSFQLGLPSNICLENCDIRPPRNLLDTDFDEDSEVLPESRPETEATRLLWYVVKERMMESFSKVSKLALSFHQKSEAEILQLDQEIRQSYSTIPDTLRPRPFSDSITDGAVLIMSRYCVQFIHLKSLCVLHRRYMARGNVYSTKACIEAATQLVSQFIAVYKEFEPGGHLCNERWMLNSFTVNEFLLGVMVLCLLIHTRRMRDCEVQVIDEATRKTIVALLEQSHGICIEQLPTLKDARRVSHAIYLTLNGSKRSNAPKNIPANPLPPPTAPRPQSTTQGADSVGLSSLSLQPQLGYVQAVENAFGPLDPFNFMGSNVDNIDWGMFDGEILDPNIPYMEDFRPIWR